MAVAIGLEILKLRHALKAGGMSARTTNAVTNFLNDLAAELLSPESSQTWVQTIARTRENAATVAAGGNDAPALRAAASMRVIAAAAESYPEFFGGKT
jgi:hypothetical protein